MCKYYWTRENEVYNKREICTRYEVKFKVFAAECKRHSEALSGLEKLYFGIFNEFKQIALIAA